MGRKKKRPPADPLSRIFCYYCDRNFQDEQTLLTHQRDKHLRCPTCHKRMLSIPSMTVHSSQMHNVQVKAVPNALPTRSDISIDVLGMKGIPDSYYASLTQQQHQQPAMKMLRIQSSQPHTGVNDTLVRVSQPLATVYGNVYNAYPQYYPQVHPQQPQPYPSVAYPPHAVYPPNPYPSNPVAYSQPVAVSPTYPPSQPSFISQSHTTRPYNQGTRQAYSRPVTSNQNLYDTQKQNSKTYGPREPPVTNTLPESRSGGQAATTSNTMPTTSAPLQAENKPKQADDVKIVFDRIDLSMEELRAQLPRYKIM